MNIAESTAHTTEAIHALLASLGIPLEAIAARALPAHPVATELVLVEVGDDGREHRLAPGAAAAWRSMQGTAAAEGIALRIVSAFRGLERQTHIFRKKLRHGQPMDAILRLTAPPGYSEHHTGRALDVTTDGARALEEEFDQTAAFRWLSRRAQDFGFFLSYPPGNPHGFSYEPWHWLHRG
jgi:D-alanyl-D-alanine carboxypeptidase